MGKSVGKMLNPFRGSPRDALKNKFSLDPKKRLRAHQGMVDNPIRNTRDLLGYGDEGSFEGFGDRYGSRERKPMKTEYTTPPAYARPDKGGYANPTGRTAPPPTVAPPTGMAPPPRAMPAPPQGRMNPQMMQARALRGGGRM